MTSNISNIDIYATQKTCKICGETKPLEDFHKSSKGKLGRANACAVCTRAKAAAKYAQDSLTGNTHYQRNRERILKQKAGGGINMCMNTITDADEIHFTFTDKTIFYTVNNGPSQFIKNTIKYYADGEEMCIEDKISHIRSFFFWNSDISTPKNIKYTPEMRQ